MMKNENNEKQWVDVRDGLTRKERVILFCLRKLQTEAGGRHVDTCMLYGRVIEYIDIGSKEMQSILQTLTTSSHCKLALQTLITKKQDNGS